MHASGLFFPITLNLMTLYFLFKWEIKILTVTEDYGYTQKRGCHPAWIVVWCHPCCCLIQLEYFRRCKIGVVSAQKSPVRQQRLLDIKEKGNYIGYFWDNWLGWLSKSRKVLILKRKAEKSRTLMKLSGWMKQYELCLEGKWRKRWLDYGEAWK